MKPNRIIPFGRPWITDAEQEAVRDVLKGDVLTHGPQCKAFEEEFSSFMGEGAHCITVSSGMAALHLSYLQMGLGPGDEVIVPSLTHVATAHAVEMVGAKAVFTDCDPSTGNMDVEKIKRCITQKTKAIGLVHFLGIPCLMDEILALAEMNKLKVVEDCALAVGSRFNGTHVGLFGESGCFSFYPVKQMTTGEGGMFVTRHKEVAERVKKWRAFGVDRSFSERSIPGMYDVLSLGLNYRMSDVNAAIGRAQLKKIDEITMRRRVHFKRLKEALSQVKGLHCLDTKSTSSLNSHYCLSVVLKDDLKSHRGTIVSKLKEAGIGTSIYYPQPVPRMTYYKNKYGVPSIDFANATEISDHSIALPVGPHLTEEDVDYISQIFIDVVKELRK